MIRIIPYHHQYEKGWVYCKALSYLFSDFFDDRSTTKDELSEWYEDSIELLALKDEKVVGLLDIGIYSKEASKSYAYYSCDKVAYFVNFAVHPDYQNRGIASRLFAKAEALIKQKEVEALAIFTRGDEVANHLYQKWGASLVSKDWLVLGRPKSEQQAFQFKVLRDEKRLQFVTQDGELPFYHREGHYIVPKKVDIELFEVDAVYEERTYLKIYQ